MYWPVSNSAVPPRDPSGRTQIAFNKTAGLLDGASLSFGQPGLGSGRTVGALHVLALILVGSAAAFRDGLTMVAFDVLATDLGPVIAAPTRVDGDDGVAPGESGIRRDPDPGCPIRLKKDRGSGGGWPFSVKD